MADVDAPVRAFQIWHSATTIPGGLTYKEAFANLVIYLIGGAVLVLPSVFRNAGMVTGTAILVIGQYYYI